MKRKRSEDDEDDGLLVILNGFRNMSMKKSSVDELSDTFKRLKVDSQVSSNYAFSSSRDPRDVSDKLDGCSARNDGFPAGNDECSARYEECSARNEESAARNATFGNGEVGALMFLEPDGLPHGFSRSNCFKLAPVLHPGL